MAHFPQAALPLPWWLSAADKPSPADGAGAALYGALKEYQAIVQNRYLTKCVQGITTLTVANGVAALALVRMLESLGWCGRKDDPMG